MFVTSALLLAFAAAPAMPAPAAPHPPSVVTQPDWLSRPSGQDLQDLYPKAAARDRVEGRATIRCKIAATGDLKDCMTLSEEPPGAGFGDAALAMAPKFKMRPMTRDGSPVSGGIVNIPIRFALAGGPLPSANAALRCYGYYAAAAERDPSSIDAQTGALLWRMALEVRTVRERWKPSDYETLLLTLRKTGAAQLESDQFKAERDECGKQLDVARPAFDQFVRLDR